MAMGKRFMIMLPTEHEASMTPYCIELKELSRERDEGLT